MKIENLSGSTVRHDDLQIHEKRLVEKQEIKEDSKPQEYISKDQLEKKIEAMNKFVQPLSTSVSFEFHEKLQEYYVQIVDDKTNEVVREIPSKKFLDMYAAMVDHMGIFVDKKV
jgi:flagellar protein FlaG